MKASTCFGFAVRVLCGVLGLVFGAVAQIVIQDENAHSIQLNRPPQRIVSLLPSLTETVCVLGACSRLVGVDRYSNWPVSVQPLPRMGGGLDPNIEAIVAARPDVVLLAGSTRGAERLESLGLTVIRLEPRTVEDAHRVLTTIAQVLGLPADDSHKIWTRIQSDWSSAAHAVPPSMRGQRVYFEVSPAPFGAGPSSFIGETLQHLGLRNIMPADKGPFPRINPEFVVHAQPDIIMIADSSRSVVARRPGWNGLRALQQDRVCVFDPAESDVLVRAGPRLAESAQLITRCLQRMARESR